MSAPLRRFFGSEAGMRAHAQLIESGFRLRLAAQERADDRSEEAERNADNSRILQGEELAAS